jgi:hypothetical protein
MGLFSGGMLAATVALAELAPADHLQSMQLAGKTILGADILLLGSSGQSV